MTSNIQPTEAKHFSWRAIACVIGTGALVSGCGLGARGPFPGVPDFVNPASVPVYKGPVAAPQVGYWIDENRYFEIVPMTDRRCSSGKVFYVDKAKGIKSLVMGTHEIGGLDLVIDAANEEFLVGPIAKGSGNCSSGGGACGGRTLPYSTDAGRTWKRARPRSSGDDVYLTGEWVLVSSGGRSEQVATLSQHPESPQAWKQFNSDKEVVPPTRRVSVDSKFHCTPNGKE